MHRKVSKQIVDRAELLYKRGYKLAEISERINISNRSLMKYKKMGDWDNDKIPSFTLTDLVEDTRIILFQYLQKVLHGKQNDDSTRISLNVKSLVNALKELEDLAPAVSARDAVETMRNFMTWIAKQNLTDSEYILKKAQEYHDIHKDAIQD
jgi:hypothetical protein